MSRFWKLTPVAAVFAFGLVVLWSGASGPPAALADVTNMSASGNVVTIRTDNEGGNLVITLGSVESDTDAEMEITDCNGCDEEGDKDDSSLTVDTDDNDYDGFVEVTVTLSCPDTDAVTITATHGGMSDTETIVCTPATPTPTVGAARTVTVQSSNASLGCNNTSIITIVVKDGAGNPVQSGTLVNIVTNLGTVSPTTGQTTADGSVFVFYTAPGNQGGVATITATAGTASGSTQVVVTCSAAPTATTAPPPTVPSQQTGGSITPPSTGDGGLRDATGWQTYAGLALTALAALSAAVLLRRRA